MKIGLTIRNINNFENIQTLCLNGAIPHNRMLYYYLKDKCELYLISDTIKDLIVVLLLQSSYPYSIVDPKLNEY